MSWNNIIIKEVKGHVEVYRREDNKFLFSEDNITEACKEINRTLLN